MDFCKRLSEISTSLDVCESSMSSASPISSVSDPLKNMLAILTNLNSHMNSNSVTEDSLSRILSSHLKTRQGFLCKSSSYAIRIPMPVFIILFCIKYWMIWLFKQKMSVTKNEHSTLYIHRNIDFSVNTDLGHSRGSLQIVFSMHSKESGKDKCLIENRIEILLNGTLKYRKKTPIKSFSYWRGNWSSYWKMLKPTTQVAGKIRWW